MSKGDKLKALMDCMDRIDKRIEKALVAKDIEKSWKLLNANTRIIRKINQVVGV